MTDERRLVSELRREFSARLPDGEGRWLHAFDQAVAALPQPATEPALDVAPTCSWCGEPVDVIHLSRRNDHATELAAQPSAEVERLNRHFLAGVLFALGYDLPGKRANEIAKAYDRAALAESDRG